METQRAYNRQLIEGSKIDVSGAITLIEKASNRLSFLLESMFREGEYEEKTADAMYGVVSGALDDLARVQGLLEPGDARDWAWLGEEIEKSPVIEWNGPDIEGDLLAPIDCLDFLLDGSIGSRGTSGLKNLSIEGFFGFKAVIEDQRIRLREILTKLNSAVH